VAHELPDPAAYLSRLSQSLKTAGVLLLTLIGLLLSLILSSDFRRWFSEAEVSVQTFTLTVAVILILTGTALIIVFRRLRTGLIAVQLASKSAEDRAQEAENETQASQAAMSNLSKVIGQLESLAYYDPITGIPNSNYLKRVLSREANITSARCLILLDLRNFGAINKTYNHWKGDAYLSRFGAMVDEAGRRNEYLMKRRPLLDEGSATGPLQAETISAFRKNSGGDEFYILLNGTIIDGLGYLNRLRGRSEEFEEMARSVLGGDHAFDFQAGLISVAHNESFASATQRVMTVLGLAMECPTSSVYWPAHELEPPTAGTTAERILKDAIDIFGDPHPAGTAAANLLP
jgi:GGDEF domain-containing protein